MKRVTTIRLDVAEIAQKAALSAKLAKAVAAYDDEVEAANGLVQQANDKMEAASVTLNAVLAEVNGFANRVHDELQRLMTSAGTDWQDTPDGEAVEEWRKAWENLDTTPVPVCRASTFDDADESLRDILDDIENTPRPPRE